MGWFKKGQSDGQHNLPAPRIDNYTDRQNYNKGRNGQ